MPPAMCAFLEIFLNEDARLLVRVTIIRGVGMGEIYWKADSEK
jgi:hypothetical protein